MFLTGIGPVRKERGTPMRRILIALAAAALSIAPLSSPAEADKPAPTPDPLVQSTEVVAEYYAPDDKTLLGTEVYGDGSEGQVLGASGGQVIPNATGSGGSSSSSGCNRVTVTNNENTLLGFTAYKFKTWTHWCWTRSSQNIYDVQHGWQISDVDSQFVWKGINNSEFGFYDYSVNDGHPRSAYKNYQQGHFENCVVKYGCIGSTYPANTLRSYYNGTWAWATDGDAN